MSRIGLYEDIISLPNLTLAWDEIKSKNSVGGIDRATTESYLNGLDKNLAALHQSLLSSSYKPEPYLKINIQKNEREFRKLGLLSISDKIVQQAIRRKIEIKFEHLFLDNSYAYRPGKGSVKAVKRVQHILQHQKPAFFISCDIDSFFDTIPHEILWHKLESFIGDEKVVSLMKLCLTIGSVSKNYKWTDNKTGIPQGAILSPLLSNFYLHSFDQAICSKTKNYIRYADDFVLLAKNEAEAQTLAVLVNSFLKERLKLQLNESPAIVPVQEGILFLGLSISVKGLLLTEKKAAKIESKIASLIIDPHIKNLSEKSIEILQGIQNYYGKLLDEESLIQLDNKIIHKLTTLFTENKLTTKVIINKVLSQVVFFSAKHAGNITKLTEIIYRQLNGNEKNNHKKDKVATIIEQKKREYQKLEAAGMELVLHQYGSFLGVSQKGIQVKVKGVNLYNNLSSSLQHITVIGSGISVSTDALRYCADRKIDLDFFDNKGQHYASIYKPEDLDAALVLKQSAATISHKGFHISCKIILSKISNQLNLLKYFSKYHKHIDPEYFSALKENTAGFIAIKEKIVSLKFDVDYQARLIAIESQGAVIYWSLVRNLIGENIAFETRERQGARDLVNCMLNYGYALLNARVWQAILIAKLHPNISFIHARQPGKPTLVYDIIEMFRAQCVDRIIISLIQKREPLTIKDGLLTDDTRKLLVANIWERINRYELYRGKRVRQIEIISEQCRDIVKYLNNDTKIFKPYIAKW